MRARDGLPANSDHEIESLATAKYQVVVNGEAQYTICSVAQSVPLGWELEGFSGRKAECLSHIANVWTDMRPLSTRSVEAFG
jgi:MbtH protein